MVDIGEDANPAVDAAAAVTNATPEQRLASRRQLHSWHAWRRLTAALLQQLRAASADMLRRAWKVARASLQQRADSGELAVLVVANFGAAGRKLPQGLPNAATRQLHIRATLQHAGQMAAFLIANEYGWGGNEGPGGDPKIQASLGFTLSKSPPTKTLSKSPPTETLSKSPPTKPLQDNVWRYPAQNEVQSRSGFPSFPGTESASCHNFIATRHSAFLLKAMSRNFYNRKVLPQQAFEGRFVCSVATWLDPPRIDWPPDAGAAAAAERPPSHFLLATWHGPHKARDTEQVAVVQQLCAHLRTWCDKEAGLCCVFAGDFNIVLQPFAPEEFAGFERLDVDKVVRRDGWRTDRPHPHRVREPTWTKAEVAQWAGRRRYGDDNRAPQKDVDHVLLYRPPGSPIEVRRSRRFRMYDRARVDVLPLALREEIGKHEGALDHDSLIVELVLPGRRSLDGVD
jgi:hypothetical protein